jgi:hypothetical protein
MFIPPIDRTTLKQTYKSLEPLGKLAHIIEEREHYMAVYRNTFCGLKSVKVRNSEM